MSEARPRAGTTPTSVGVEALAVAAVILGGVAGAVGLRTGCGGPRATVDQCEDILARYVEARARQLDPAPSAAMLAKSRAASAELAARSPRFARCAETVRADAAKCALDAGDADAIERCLQ